MLRYFLLLLFLPLATIKAQYYYPSNGQWDTLSPSALNWCPQEIARLDSFLLASNSKSFIILKNGKIAHEAYYGSFTQDSVWYWASAAKTLTAFLIGKAQEDGLLTINDSTSQYLGSGWTSAPANKESLITIKHQLQMTTGLDYQVADLDCTADTCLLYRADAGSQWYYHNAPYLLLRDVLQTATNRGLNNYTQQVLAGSIGFRGIWLDNLYISNARQMARFGLLLLSEGQWNGNVVLGDTAYFRQMTSPSQNLNPAYGYLTWLNGQGSFIQPGLPWSFSGMIIPSAPADLYMAAGKNDQRIYVVPSLDMVVVRQGNAADSVSLALSGFDDQLWTYIMNLNCQGIALQEEELKSDYIYPNPSQGIFHLPQGKELVKVVNARGQLIRVPVGSPVDLRGQAPGLYCFTFRDGSRQVVHLAPWE